MLYHLIKNVQIFMPLMFGVSFGAGFFSLKYLMRLLPKDKGREFAVNGALSEGKPRGAGIIMITAFVVCSVLFVPFDAETAINMVLIYAAMLTGFLDDAAKTPWGELKKGLLDLVITGGITANFMFHNPTTIVIYSAEFTMNPVVFGILCMVLVWTSINVTNCCDGVDGLCAMLTMSTLVLFIMHGLPANMKLASDVLLMVLMAYLWFNSSPSKLLMGDAGSRALGVFLALAALHSRNPFLFIFFALVIIIDGGLGLLKLSVRRFLKKKDFMENIRTPIHDHWRKKLGMSDTQVVLRFTLLQTAIGLIFLRCL